MFIKFGNSFKKNGRVFPPKRPLFFANSIKPAKHFLPLPFHSSPFFISKRFENTQTTESEYKGDGSKSVVSLVNSGSPLIRYDKLVEMGAINNDEHQREVVKLLDRLYQQTTNYNPPITEYRTIITRKKKEHKGFVCIFIRISKMIWDYFIYILSVNLF